jgi:ATP-dependent DNA ligase
MRATLCASWLMARLLPEAQESRDPTGWWMSEKLDGVRAYWDGKQLLSRLGNPLAAPDWFTQRFPVRAAPPDAVHRA